MRFYRTHSETLKTLSPLLLTLAEGKCYIINNIIFILLLNYLLNNNIYSLTKLAYYSTVKFKINKVRKDEKELYDVSESEKEAPRLHFIVFENQYLDEALDFITEQIKVNPNVKLQLVISKIF